MFEIPITNKTMNLADCADKWFFDEKHRVWCLEDILYTDKATTPKFQRLSIFVPEEYMKAGGEIVPDGEHNGWTAATAPVIFENNSAGYMQMPHVWLDGPRCYAHPYLKQGYVYVTCGNRGHESKDRDGKFVGRAPINLIDLKTGIRFIRHNAASLPGDMNKLISVGWSAGGAMSTLLAVTGDHPDYVPYLEANGAFMDESDAVFASQIYCPIIDLEHADLAYEWLFGADKENEASPAGPAGTMTPFEAALSKRLSEDYIQYFNSLGLKHPETGELLVIDPDGRSGSGYDYLMDKLSQSATIYMSKLGRGELPEKYSVEDYLSGNYTFKAPAPMGPKKDDADLMQGHAGPGVALNRPPMGDKPPFDQPPEPPTLGDMVSRPPKGVEAHPFVPPMTDVQGRDKHAWLRWDGERATITDLDAYVLNHRRRMKPCTSFDVLAMNSGENKVFGNADIPARHFNTDVAKAIEDLKDAFPQEYAKYYSGYAEAIDNEEQLRQKYLINPLNYIREPGSAKQAQRYRIRVGASDADTSFTVSMTLACMLAAAGKDVDYQLVWDQPHSEADYPGEVIDWIEAILR